MIKMLFLHIHYLCLADFWVVKILIFFDCVRVSGVRKKNMWGGNVIMKILTDFMGGEVVTNKLGYFFGVISMF